jgi:hypothetical protein
VSLRGCELWHVEDLGFVVCDVDLWFCSYSVMRLRRFEADIRLVFYIFGQPTNFWRLDS